MATYREYLEMMIEQQEQELKSIERDIDYDFENQEEEELTREEIAESYEEHISKIQEYKEELERELQVTNNEIEQAEAFAREFKTSLDESSKTSSTYAELKLENYAAVIEYLTKNNFNFEIKTDLEDLEDEFKIRFSNHRAGGRYSVENIISYDDGDVFVWYK